MALRSIASPIKVARRVMENPGVNCLAGEGALKFALEEGFRKEGNMTRAAHAQWEEWVSSYRKSDDQLNVLAFLAGATRVAP